MPAAGTGSDFYGKLDGVSGAGRAGTASSAAGKGRHSLYYNLVDAFEQRGCPICRLGLVSTYRWLDAFAYESVNDFNIRASLRASKGFCTTHAWQLLDDVHDLLGSAIVYRDVIHTSLPGVRAAVHRPAALEPAGICRACAALDESCARYLDVFRESLPDRNFRVAYASGQTALCLPHARRLLERLSRREIAADAARLVAARWQAALHPVNVADGAGGGGANGRGPRRYRGVAGATTTFSAASFAAPEPAILRDPAVVPLEILVGRLRTATLRSGLRTMGELEVPPAADVTHGEPEWEAACEPGACPICRLTLFQEERRLHQVQSATCNVQREGAWGFQLGSGLGDEEAAGALAEDEVRALCNAHAWRLAERGHAGALVPACSRAVDAATGALAAAEAPREASPRIGGWPGLAALLGSSATAGERLAAHLDVEADCAWCVERAAAEAAYVDRLLSDVRRRPEMLSLVGRSGGLCRLHFVRAMERGGGSAAAAKLANLQLERWSTLRDELLEYIRKQDFQYHDEPRGQEQTSPWRAAEQVAGARGIRP
ncbi:MAG: hypothetical protein HY332_13320 [Chloroflexi bacterium]|nr:hypothetical protein [Chloroflexota bacterium]